MALAGLLATSAVAFAAAKTEAKAKPYPLETCVVSGKSLSGVSDPYVFAYQGREVKLCCKDCRAEFDKAPVKFLAKVDEAAKKVKPYPLKTCVVSGEKLGEMGDAYVFVYKGQEVKLCCKSCKKDFDKDPTKFLTKLGAATK